MLGIIVLAAGLSGRMAPRNKLLLPFGTSTILQTTLAQLSALEEEQIMVLGHDLEKLQPLLTAFSGKIVFNTRYADGMTTSIQAGIRAASPESEGFMICLADMPLIDTDTYRLLTDRFYAAKETNPALIVQPVFKGQPGNPVIFSAHYRNELLALDFMEGCKPVVQKYRQQVEQVEVASGAIFQDADTEESYQALLKQSVH